jgi:mannosyltransferase OCH1-like enzyme
MSDNVIPRKLHLIWVGDQSNQPSSNIESWREKHPGWEVKVWGNAEYESVQWICKRQMEAFHKHEMLAGVADIMRYEILCEHGGVYVDADSTCLRPIDELRMHRMFAVYESEQHAPGVVANGFIGSVPGHPVLTSLISEIYRLKDPTQKWAWAQMKYRKVLPWRSVGPKLFTQIIKRHPTGTELLPSILFLPQHYKDKEERDIQLAYARHHWASTLSRKG